MAVSPPGSSGSSPGLLGEFRQRLRFECSWTRSNTFFSFVGLSLVSSARPDACDASALPCGSPDST